MPYWTPQANIWVPGGSGSAPSTPGTPLDLVGSYGVVADGHNHYTGAVNGTTNFNDPGAPFTAGDVGKYFVIEGGGAANNAGNYSLVGQFTAYVDASNMTMSVTAPITASGLTYVSYTTDNAAAIATALAALPGSTHGGQIMLAPNSLSYMIESPIILNNKQTLMGQGAWNVSNLRAGANFPKCVVAGGGFTTPALAATTFTVTVDAVPTWMQLPNALITNGVGVATVGGIEFSYTGTTGTTFTGCKTRFNNVVVAAGAPLSTFMVWVDQPGTSGGGFEQGLADISLDVGGIGGVGGVYMPHAQETSGLSRVLIRWPDNLGVRVAEDAGSVGQYPLDYTMDEVNVVMAASCDVNSIGIDAWGVSRRGMRGIGRCSVASTGVAITAKAAIRMNGFSSGQHGPFHIESFNDGLLIGDVLQTGPISVRGIERGGVTGTTNLVHIGNVAGHQIRLEDISMTNTVSFPGTVAVKDDLNGNTITEYNLSSYAIDMNGNVTTDANTAEFNVKQPVGSSPTNNNFKAWSGDIRYMTQAPAMTSGVVYLSRLLDRVNQITPTTGYFNFATNTMGTLTNCYMGIYARLSGNTLTLIGVSADQSAIWTTTGLKTPTIVVVGGQSLTQPANIQLYGAVLANFVSGAATVRNVHNTLSGNGNQGTNDSWWDSTITGGSTSLPATVLTSGLTQGVSFWMGVS